jgi:hypothetical protein
MIERIPVAHLLQWKTMVEGRLLDDYSNPSRTKKGERTAGQDAAIRTGEAILHMIDRELRRRGNTNGFTGGEKGHE